VLASGNKIGGFSAFGGAVAKERLLAMEGVMPGDGTPLLRQVENAGRFLVKGAIGSPSRNIPQ
jgi:hypothetical protein